MPKAVTHPGKQNWKYFSLSYGRFVVEYMRILNFGDQWEIRYYWNTSHHKNTIATIFLKSQTLIINSANNKVSMLNFFKGAQGPREVHEYQARSCMIQHGCPIMNFLLSFP